MAELPHRTFDAPAGDAIPVARQHYTEGVGWLARRDVADNSGSRTACAAMATACFAAGQLALAIAKEEVRRAR